MFFKELGKPTASASPVLCIPDELTAPKDLPLPAYPTTPSTTCKQAALARSPTRPKQDLNPVADKFGQIAQTRTKVWSLTNDNKSSSDSKIPSAETGLSRTKVVTVVEGTPQNPKKQGPMWTSPSWRSIVAQRRGSSADKWWVRCGTGPGSDDATATPAEISNTGTVAAATANATANASTATPVTANAVASKSATANAATAKPTAKATGTSLKSATNTKQATATTTGTAKPYNSNNSAVTARLLYAAACATAATANASSVFVQDT